MEIEIDKSEVGQRIKEIRQALGLSMDKFGKLLGDLPRSTVNNWERGVNLPKLETLNRISEVGNVTNEYILYGNQEDEYIANLLRKKAGETSPAIEQLMIGEMKELGVDDDRQLNTMIQFITENLTPPSDEDYFSFQLLDVEKRIYLVSNNFGKTAKLYLHYDMKEDVMHLMPFTFADHSVSRLMIFLTNAESLQYFTKNLYEGMVGKPVILYSLDASKQELEMAPFIYSKREQAYQLNEKELQVPQNKLYLPFVEELMKLKMFNQLLDD